MCVQAVTGPKITILIYTVLALLPLSMLLKGFKFLPIVSLKPVA